MFLFALVNLKGGVGKTSSALQLAHAFRLLNFSTLAIDLDPQANLTSALGLSEKNMSTFNLLLDNSSPAHSSVSHLMPNLDLIAGDEKLDAADELLLPNHPLGQRASVLRWRLRGVEGEYKVAVIDTPPHLRTLTLNALVAADEVIIPVTADIFASNALVRLAKVINMVRSSLNPSLRVGGVLLTRFNRRSRLMNSFVPIFEKFAETLGSKLYKAKIRDSVKVAESSSMHLPLCEYEPTSSVACDYAEWFEEVRRDERKI